MDGKHCKYCNNSLVDIEAEGVQCQECSSYVHLNCLQRGSVPGALFGDVFFEYTCQECSQSGLETFNRDKMTWLQTIVLVLYHLNKKSPRLARRGFYHWKIHIAAFVDKNWDILFKKDFKRTKKWTGTIPGILSVCSPHFFTSGTALFNEQGWWTLTYPGLSPNIIVQLNSEILTAKQKLKEQGCVINETNILKEILQTKSYGTEENLINSITLLEQQKPLEEESSSSYIVEMKKDNPKPLKNIKQKRTLLPSFENICERSTKKLFKESSKEKDTLTSSLLNDIPILYAQPNEDLIERKVKLENDQKHKLLDPYCHYNTSLQNISTLKGIHLKIKLLGKIREEPILSPYSNIYLKPYIRRDADVRPPWLELMAELQIKSNQHDPNWTLPSRGPLDYTYVQPEHIPAINSLCNQFFWHGIDLTECLQYPDFSCVVLYRKLIVGFAFIVPDVKFNESYVSFLFTRPAWRNVGIGKFMVYHLIQTCTGKDITLHVSINNSALFLYQKFGFKVENVVLDFYDKYIRGSRESKHAFFCRLER